MAKITKSHPNSKRKGVKKEPMPYIIIFQTLNYITPDGYALTPPKEGNGEMEKIAGDKKEGELARSVKIVND